jgi:hypothetical protein
MGYRSDVAYAIVFASPEDKTKVIDRLTPEQWQLIQRTATVGPDRILFHDTAVKWYSRRVTGVDDGYAEVNAHEALLEEAQVMHDEHSLTDGARGVQSLGVFMRLGEDDDDFERNVWGEEAEGISEDWYDLVDLRRELVVGWK